MGEEIVVWCDDQGSVCVAGAYCPHLGADLGPDTGGRVCDGRLVCPFHGYEYDATGQCVATPYSDPPKTAKLRVFETREITRHDLCLVGHPGTGTAVAACPRAIPTRPVGAASGSEASAFRATRRRRRRTLSIWATCATSTATTV